MDPSDSMWERSAFDSEFEPGHQPAQEEPSENQEASAFDTQGVGQSLEEEAAS